MAVIHNEQGVQTTQFVVHDEPHDPLVAACRLVGGALGIAIRAPFPATNAAPHYDPLAAIVRASRIRTRQVILKGAWWRRDNGPLLAYREADKQPVALLPRGSRHYDLVDPMDGSRTPMNGELANSLATFAVMFYRPLPERALTQGDVLRFGLRGSWNDLRTMLCLGIANGLLALALPLATGWMFGTLVPAGRRAEIVQLGLALAVSAGTAAIFHTTYNIARIRFEARMGAALDAALWDRLLSLPPPFFRAYTAGDLGDRVMGVSTVWQTLARSALAAGLAGIAALWSFLLLVWYDAGLALIALGLVLVFALVPVLLGLAHMRRQRVVSRRQGYASGLILQVVSGIAKFRVTGAEQRAFEQWMRAFEHQQTAVARAGIVSSALVVWNGIAPMLAATAIFAAAVNNNGTARLSTGTFLAFLVAFAQLMLAGLTTSRALTAGLRVVPLLQRAMPILQTLPEVDEAGVHPGKLAGGIALNHVSFRYKADGPLILNDVSLHIQPGAFVAIVGPSGSGKSTLLRLLLGFERPERGVIMYDGQDLATLDVREVRRQIGVVLQNGTLMADDLFHNIVGSSLLTVEDAWEATRMVGLDEEIRQLPMGMHTMVPEGGSTFSGGQRQRMLIARALVHKPRILFFDEATSALDNTTQATVSASLAQLQATRLVIAHRLSTVQHADRIVVLDHGAIVESGTYAELMQQDGVFAALARRQIS